MTSATNVVGPRVVTLRHVTLNGKDEPKPTEVSSTDPKQNALEVVQQHPNATAFHFTTHKEASVEGEIFTTPSQRNAVTHHIGEEIDTDKLDKMTHIPQHQRDDVAFQLSVGMRVVYTQAGFHIMGSNDVAISVFAEAVRTALQT